MPFNDETIHTIIFSQFNEHASAIEKIEMGVMTFKYKFRLGTIDYILRIYPPENTTDVSAEFIMMQRLFTGGCKFLNR